MKTLKEIKKAINKNFARRQEISATIDTLYYTEKRREVLKNGDRNAWKEIYKKAEENSAEISELSKDLYILNIEARILAENAKAALFAEAYPVIIEACKKYAGKPYGEATKNKIYEEVKKAGYGFYFSGICETDKVCIYELNDGGFKCGKSLEVEAIAIDEAGHMAQFITKENKINVQEVSARPRAKYVEKTASHARTVAKAVKKYEEATKSLEAERRALCSLMPAGLPSPDYIHEYRLVF